MTRILTVWYSSGAYLGMGEELARLGTVEFVEVASLVIFGDHIINSKCYTMLVDCVDFDALPEKLRAICIRTYHLFTRNVGYDTVSIMLMVFFHHNRAV